MLDVLLKALSAVVGTQKRIWYIIDTSRAKPSRMYPTTCKLQAMVARLLASQTGFAYRRWALIFDQTALMCQKYAHVLVTIAWIVQYLRPIMETEMALCMSQASSHPCIHITTAVV
jgi:hypothetical protein